MGVSNSSFIVVYFFILFSVLVSKGYSKSPTIRIVHVQNDIEGNDVYLNIHCHSNDDDLGEHVLRFGEEWNWSFHLGIGTTHFWCDYKWYDNWNRRWYEGIHEVYHAKIFGFKDKYYNFCRNNCLWSARRDGLHLYRVDRKGKERRYTWDP
ncbi:hypothetical protein MKW92_023837 [Papaver armeniacum]|nr:hypothetical protein MKW92_023837 [Papaver armeniacum]